MSSSITRSPAGRRFLGAATAAVAACALWGSGAHAAPAPSGYVAIGPVKLLTKAVLKAGETDSAAVIGGSTTVPSDANSVQLSIAASAGKANGGLLVYPAGDPDSAPVLSWTVGQSVSRHTTVAPGAADKVRFVNSSTRSVTVTVRITAYSAQGQPGPKGPAGMTTGYIGYSTPEKDFPAAGTAIVAVKSPPLPAGSYAVTASVQVVAHGDDVECWIDGWESAFQAGISADAHWDTVSWTDVDAVADGSRIVIDCLDFGGNNGVAQVDTSRVVAIPLQAEVVEGS